ncbi:MAG: UDP-3-O-(3-hydroxymyristoyl)glucosamine N-acyltransferase [Pseudomonadota bacterium]
MKENKFDKNLAELATHVGAHLHGDATAIIHGIGTIHSAQPGQITFLDNSDYRRYLPETKATAVILTARNLAKCPTNALVVDSPYYAYAKLAELFINRPALKQGIHPSAIIGENCDIADSAHIGAKVVIGDHVKIGANTIISAGCVIDTNCQIGDNCFLASNVTCYDSVMIANRVTIHSGVVIGSDGFGFAKKDNQWHKVPQLGQTIIHDDVEIGANSTIDRGAIGNTVIHKGVKLDNQIQIAHNVIIGEHTAIAANTAIAGSTKIGNHCSISGGVSINGHIEICDHTLITGAATVSSSIKTPDVYSSSLTVMPHKQWIKNIARLHQLDKTLKNLKQSNHREIDHATTQHISTFSTKRVPAVTETLFDTQNVRKYLPQREPFLFIDRVVEYVPEKYIIAIKNVTGNEPFFAGHFPGQPVMPGVLILEALAQAGNVYTSILSLDTENVSAPPKPVYFAGINKARFKRVVEPGDQLILRADFVKKRLNTMVMQGTAFVGDEVVCTAELLCAIPREDKK